jgi:hypothetical protein
MAAREQAGAGAGVVAGSVAPVVGGVVAEAGKDLKAVPHIGGGRERFVQLVLAAFAPGKPPVVVRAVREADKRGAQRHAGCCRGERRGAGGGGRGARQSSDERFERGKRNERAEAAEERAATDMGSLRRLALSHHSPP